MQFIVGVGQETVSGELGPCLDRRYPLTNLYGVPTEFVQSAASVLVVRFDDSRIK